MRLPIDENVVMLGANAENPESAIRLAGSMLVNSRKVEQSYVEAMVGAYKELGPYIVIAPMIAVPHARPDQGVNEQCMSILRLKEPMVFGHPTNDPVQLVCAIGGVDKSVHIRMLRVLSEILGDEEKLELMMKAESYKQLIQAFQ